MPEARCIRKCWDSQLTRRYYPGDQDNIPEDHVFIKSKCFEFIENPKPIPVAPVKVQKVQTVVIPEKMPVEEVNPVAEVVEEDPVKKK